MSSVLATLPRHPARGRRLGLYGVLIATLAMAVSPLQVAAATPYDTNLVKNGGAQHGLNNWDTFPDGDFRTQSYGASGLGFPSQSASNAIGGGSKFFYAGPYDNAYGTCGDAQQEWTLTGIGSAIDGGHVKVVLKGYHGTSGAADLNAHTDLYFRNASNHSVAVNGITRTATNTNEQYVSINTSRKLPNHTRILRLHLWADGDATLTSGDCRTFWDKLKVTLKYV
jgi:hypothetical protein